MNAVGAVGRCLVFATPDAHVTGETLVTVPRLRLERVFEAGLPPRIGWRRRRGGHDRSDRRTYFRGLHWGQLDVHVRKS